MINRLEYSIDIEASSERIWNALWNDEYYRDWSSVFGAGSHFLVDDWSEGSSIMFLGTDKGGIYSNIERYLPKKVVQFKHIGVVKDGQAQPIDEEVKKWTGCTETYSLNENDDRITLLVEIDVMDEHMEFMKNKLSLALDVVKKNSEGGI